MRTTIALAVALAAIVCAGPASADRIIFAPTGSLLAPGQVKVEGVVSSGGADNRIYWAGIGAKRFEINAIRFDTDRSVLGAQDVDIIGAELGIIPETILTPGIGIGAWDVTDKTADGRGVYLAVSKGVPLTKELPLPIRDIKLHAGIGAGGINGLFAGAEAALPMGLKFSAERFQHQYNFALGWEPVSALKVEIQRLGSDTYYGIEFTSPVRL